MNTNGKINEAIVKERHTELANYLYYLEKYFTSNILDIITKKINKKFALEDARLVYTRVKSKKVDPETTAYWLKDHLRDIELIDPKLSSEYQSDRISKIKECFDYLVEYNDFVDKHRRLRTTLLYRLKEFDKSPDCWKKEWSKKYWEQMTGEVYRNNKCTRHIHFRRNGQCHNKAIMDGRCGIHNSIDDLYKLYKSSPGLGPADLYKGNYGFY
jgi:hypothetical protein